MQKVYFFKGENYARYDIPRDEGETPATSIKENWKPFPVTWKKIDATLNWGNGKIYFFSGDQYIRYDILLDTVDQLDKPISTGWHGLPSSWKKIDGAVNWGNGEVYFFNNNKYVRYNILLDEVDQDELLIKDHWHGYPWDRVDAVLNYGDDRVYMFHGKEYVRYSVSQDKVDTPKRSITANWTGLPTGWDSFDDAVIIDLTAEKMGYMLEHNIGPETVGYAYTIYEDKRLVKTGSGGLRMKPNFPFTINTEMGIGSITKTLTAMATLKCLVDNKDKIKPVGNLFDAPIVPWLPKGWQPHDSIKKITFRHLLGHTSGIRTEGDSYQALKSILQMGVLKDDQDVYEYRNPNFSLMRVLIPIITGDTPLSIKEQNSNQEAFNAKKVADAYKAYLQKNVFKPCDVHDADCRLNSNNYAMLYGARSQDLDAYTYVDNDDSSSIAGAGGWKLSVLELGRVINAFFTSERIVPFWIRDVMINESLGFEAPRSVCVKATKNGSWGTKQGYHNCYYIFTDGIQCVLMTNSLYPDTPMDPESAVQAAHAASFGCC